MDIVITLTPAGEQATTVDLLDALDELKRTLALDPGMFGRQVAGERSRNLTNEFGRNLGFWEVR